MRKIIFYKTASGKCPAVDFLDNLSARQAQKVTWVLRVIEDLPLVPTKYFKKLVHTEEIWEVRVAVENNIFRLLGFFDGSDLIVIDNAFQKKTQKTPTKEIQLADSKSHSNQYLCRLHCAAPHRTCCTASSPLVLSSRS